MNQALKFRKRLSEVGLILGAILFLAFYVAFRSALTSSNQEKDLVECYSLGVNSYIQKPVGLQKFQETVRQFGMYWLMVNHMPPRSAFNGKVVQGA